MISRSIPPTGAVALQIDRRAISLTLGAAAVALIAGSIWGSAQAAPIDSPAAPTDGASAMYTLEELFARLSTGAAGSKRSGIFVEPAAGPGSTTHTLNDLMDAAPAMDSMGGATEGEVLAGRSYWGLQSGGWGALTGTMPIQTLSAGSTTVNAGYYAATDLASVEADLIPANIKSGRTLFGITGIHPIARVNNTGQTISYTATWGEDGDLEKGEDWPDPRFNDNGNGTVTDNYTGLIWLKDARCLVFFDGDASVTNLRDWEHALTAANSLADGYCGLTDGSVAGDWRLPNIDAIQSLVNYGNFHPALPTVHPFLNVENNYYWSSTTDAGHTDYAWVLDMANGSVGNFIIKTSDGRVWPVRGGV